MCSDCVTYKTKRSTLSVYGRQNQYDPTRTITLRQAFVSDVRKRFRKIRGLIRVAVVDRDVFGLSGQAYESHPQLLAHAVPARQAFAFTRSGEKVRAFMGWLDQQVEREMLTVTAMPQLGTGVEGAWTNMYVHDSYKRGVMRANYEMRGAGFNVPNIDEQGGIDAMMGTPFHMDRVGVLYSRVFEELRGITAAMDQQISRVLAEGMIHGDGPALLARKMNATISGMGIGTLGLTDTLGRFIPAERRATILARTEVIRAHHLGAVQEYKNWRVEGVRVRAEFRSADDERVCWECEDLERGGPYTLEEVEGMIPVHPQCRCVAIPTQPEIDPEAQRREGQVFEEDGVAYKTVNEAELQKIENKLIDEVRLIENKRLSADGMSADWLYKAGKLKPQHINQGLCDVWADRFVNRFGGAIRVTDMGDGSGTSGHYWVQLGRRFFDAETFRRGGVRNLTDLPFFERAAKHRGKRITMRLIDPSRPFHLTDVAQKAPIPTTRAASRTAVQNVRQRGLMHAADTFANCVRSSGPIGTYTVRPDPCRDIVRVNGRWMKQGRPVSATEAARLDRLRIPPGWRDVVVSADPSAELLAIGLDSKNRWVYRYSQAAIDRKAAQKFVRVRNFSADVPNIRAGIETGVNNDVTEAYLLKLEHATAIRAGSAADRAARVKAYGLTTLQHEHVTVRGNRIILEFVAKKGVPARYELRDNVLAAWLKERKAATRVGQMLFPDTSASKVNAYLRQLAGGKSYSIKDFRTYHATRIAREELKQYAGQILTDQQRREIINEVSMVVSKFLHNTPKMALDAYIDPMVWEIIGGRL